MTEREPTTSPEVLPPQPAELTIDDWRLIQESVDDYLRSYVESDYTWWEPDDDRPARLEILLQKLQAALQSTPRT